MNNSIKTFTINLSAILVGISLMFSHQASALDIIVNAKVVVPPCTVNNGNVIEVDFGDSVVIPLINGANYRTTIPYSIQCDASAPNALKLQIEGNGATFNSDALQTSEKGLGIIFFQDGQSLAINRKLNVSYTSLPIFEAAPIKEKNEKLNAGEFTAAATLAIYYN